MTLKRRWMASPNFGSRGGSGVRLIVIHTTEGASTIEALGSWFQNPSAQASSHVGIDDEAGVGTIGEYVKRGNSAWTQAAANPYCVSAELCAYAKWTRAEWEKHPTMIENCRRWVHETAAQYGIPLKKLSASQAQAGGRGVCGHVDLGAAGGGHWDPGEGFDYDWILGGGEPAQPAAPVYGALPFLTGLEDSMPPEYVLNDQAGKRKLACYASGLVRELHGPEWGHVRDAFNVPLVPVDSKDLSDRLFAYDQALRGQVKERD